MAKQANLIANIQGEEIILESGRVDSIDGVKPDAEKNVPLTVVANSNFNPLDHKGQYVIVSDSANSYNSIIYPANNYGTKVAGFSGNTGAYVANWTADTDCFIQMYLQLNGTSSANYTHTINVDGAELIREIGAQNADLRCMPIFVKAGSLVSCGTNRQGVGTNSGIYRRSIIQSPITNANPVITSAIMVPNYSVMIGPIGTTTNITNGQQVTWTSDVVGYARCSMTSTANSRLLVSVNGTIVAQKEDNINGNKTFIVMVPISPGDVIVVSAQEGGPNTVSIHYIEPKFILRTGV